MLLFGKKGIERVDLTKSASLKNVASNNVFHIEDCIGGVEKISLS